MFKNKSQSILWSIVVFLVIASTPVQAKTAYVSDELKVPLRSGASNGHRIIKFLPSGTALTVLQSSGDFTEIEVSGGKSGWVLSEQVMNVPSGRARLAVSNKKLTNAKQQVKELKNTIAELKSEIRQLTNDKGSLENERTNLSNSLDDLKITAANPLSLSKKNKRLRKDLDKVREKESMLEKDNQQLRSNVAQEWFIIGGGVAIGSLILGLIITRINWRRKRDNWGDSF
ncbi:MAG: TIGR04211 family SH3 domain-containing protein [Gammaproteobacteria bacterium]|nr:TIGR04211 family SH3 domain-containing protein [Gammaproteobacteria bacterium]